MSLGEKIKKRRMREKIKQKREETPTKISLLVSAKLIFLGEGGDNMIYLIMIYIICTPAIILKLLYVVIYA